MSTHSSSPEAMNSESSVDGVRVLELVGQDSGIAAAFAGWQLAGIGAKVSELVSDANRDTQRYVTRCVGS